MLGKYVQNKKTFEYGKVEGQDGNRIEVLWVDTLTHTIVNVEDVIIK